MAASSPSSETLCPRARASFCSCHSLFQSSFVRRTAASVSTTLRQSPSAPHHQAASTTTTVIQMTFHCDSVGAQSIERKLGVYRRGLSRGNPSSGGTLRDTPRGSSSAYRATRNGDLRGLSSRSPEPFPLRLGPLETRHDPLPNPLPLELREGCK